MRQKNTIKIIIMKGGAKTLTAILFQAKSRK